MQKAGVHDCSISYESHKVPAATAFCAKDANSRPLPVYCYNWVTALASAPHLHRSSMDRQTPKNQARVFHENSFQWISMPFLAQSSHCNPDRNS